MTKRSSCCVAIVTCHNTINRTPRLAWGKFLVEEFPC